MANKIYVLVYRMAPGHLSDFSKDKKFINKFNTILYVMRILFISKKSEKCEKKLNTLTGAAKAQRYIKNEKIVESFILIKTTFLTGVSLLRFLPPFIGIKGNKTAEIQRHTKNNRSSPVWLFFFACVSLRYIDLYLCSAKQKNNTQRITPPVLKMRWWMLWYCQRLVFGAFLSSYAHFNIYSRKGTGRGSSLMILTFFVNESLATMVANNKMSLIPVPCGLFLISKI